MSSPAFGGGGFGDGPPLTILDGGWFLPAPVPSTNFPIPQFAFRAPAIFEFTPLYPPTKKTPYTPLEALRHDSISSSGIKQSVWERTDTFVVLQFDTVPESDLLNWQAFFTYALKGNQFTYFPDTVNASVAQVYTLEDQNWAPQWKSYQTYSFSMKMRLVLTSSLLEEDGTDLFLLEDIGSISLEGSS